MFRLPIFAFATLSILLQLASITSAQPLAPKAPAPPPTPRSLNLPEGTSPMLGFFQGIDAKEKKFKLAFIDSAGEVVEKTVKKNGVEETVLEQVYKPIVMANGVPVADVKFYNVQGQLLTQASVLARLKIGDTLVVSGDEKPIAAAYLKVIRPDAILVVLPLDSFFESLLDDVFLPPPPGDLGPVPPAPQAPPAPPAK